MLISSLQLRGVYLLDPSMKDAKVVGFEQNNGKVKVITVMTFDDTNDDPGEALVESVADGTLGELSVDPDSVGVKKLSCELSSCCLHSQKRATCSESAIIKPISGCVRIACSALMITSLLQVVNRLAASCELHAMLDASCFINLQQVCKYQVASFSEF